MINPIITTKIAGLVGFTQPYNPDYAILDVQNIASRSGLFVNSNSMAKVEFLKDCNDYTEISDANFNIYLRDKIAQSSLKVCNEVFNEPDFIDRQILYPNALNLVATTTLPSGFIGYEIKTSNKKNVSFNVSNIYLNFEGTGSIKLLLLNSMSSTPIYSEVVAIASKNQLVKLNWVVDNTDYFVNGTYYLGYLSNYGSIGTLKPYARDYEDSNSVNEIRELEVNNINVLSHSTESIFDLRNIVNVDYYNGLNLDINVFFDYSDFVIKNELLFATAINLQCQIDVLGEILSSIQSNRNKRIGENMIVRFLQEIDGQSGDNIVKITGLRSLLFSSITKIRSEINKLQLGTEGSGYNISTLQ